VINTLRYFVTFIVFPVQMLWLTNSITLALKLEWC